jgi:hypothetical protein
VLESIFLDVENQSKAALPFLRYLSLAHLTTNGVALDETRDDLNKVLDRLSRKSGTTFLVPIDADRTLFRINTDELGWDARPFKIIREGKGAETVPIDLFDLVLLEYPFGVTNVGSPTFKKLATEYLTPAGMVRSIPYVRADCFIDQISLPPVVDELGGRHVEPRDGLKIKA